MRIALGLLFLSQKDSENPVNPINPVQKIKINPSSLITLRVA